MFETSLDMLELNGNLLRRPLLLGLCVFGSFLLHSVVSQIPRIPRIPQIPLGSRLSVSDNTSWVSPNGDFELGFFNTSDQPNRYSVGIRFRSVSIPVDERAVVWVVGADLVVGDGSYFELNGDGEMVLFDLAKGVSVWTSKTGSFRVESGALNDNGNLVLLSESGGVVWQSFDFPSDTLVPGQNFTAFHTLRAASKNSVSSYYSLFMNMSGQLQLRWESSVNYWTSTSRPGSNLTAVFTLNGGLEIRDRNWETVWSVYGEDHNETVRYRFLRLDIDGNLRMYSWSGALRSWGSVWQAVENQCDVFGTCGQRGVCVYAAESGLPACICPFKLVNETVPSCLIPFPQRCKSGFYMLNYRNMLLYAIYPPSNDFVSRVSLEDCKDLCLRDPLCTAATFTNDGTTRCFVKKTQYVSGYADPSLRSVSFVKRCLDPMAVNPNHGTPFTGDGPRKGSFAICFPCLIGAISGTSVLFVLIQLTVIFFVYRRKKSIMKKAVWGQSGSTPNGLIVLSFSEIKTITCNFESQIGPTVFRGLLLSSNQSVAVKEIKSAVEERKYRVAVSKIGSIHHKNIIKLEGYCCEPSHRFLVYEYAENVSVDKHLEDPKLCKRLTWAKRVEICLSVARAICYLHTGCREFVGHGNLKCENVVLDVNFEAKVTEFGLCGLANGVPCPAETDVEDFGKMVLVLVTGCKAAGEGIEDVSEWTYKEWIEGNALNAVDKRIVGVVGQDELDRVLRIAFWCLQTDERMRPSMREVVKVLEGTLSVDPAPPPFSCRRQFDDDEDEGLSEAGSEPNSRRF